MLVKYIMLFVLMAIRPFSACKTVVVAMEFINIASSSFCSSFSFSQLHSFSARSS